MNSKYGLPTSTPEEQGVSSRSILAFIDEIESEYIELLSLIIMRNGHIITDGYWAPFTPDKPFRMFSAAKALVAMAILFTIQEGQLGLESTLADIFPDKIPSSLGENLKKLNIYHMLTMTTGHGLDPFSDILVPGSDRQAVFFQHELMYEPGTHFLYNNGVPEMFGWVIYRLFRETILSYLKPRLFNPLGMNSFRADMYGPVNEWVTICCSAKDLFKLTLFLYQEGMWDGIQLLDSNLVRLACSYLVPSLQDPEPPAVAHDTRFGYGFQIWRNSVGGFRIDGSRGQFGIGIPEMNLVACMRSNECDQNIIPILFWKHITNHLYTRPLHSDPDACNRLTRKISSLTKAPTESIKPGSDFSGIYQMQSNFFGCDKLSLKFHGNTLELHGLCKSHSTGKITTRISEWSKGQSPFLFPEIVGGSNFHEKPLPGMDPKEIVTSGHWADKNKYELFFRSDAWLGAYILTLDFTNGQPTFSLENSISYTLRNRNPNICPSVLGTHEKIQITSMNAYRIS